jgi:hypothetical protein
MGWGLHPNFYSECRNCSRAALLACLGLPSFWQKGAPFSLELISSAFL